MDFCNALFCFVANSTRHPYVEVQTGPRALLCPRTLCNMQFVFKKFSLYLQLGLWFSINELTSNFFEDLYPKLSNKSTLH